MDTFLSLGGSEWTLEDTIELKNISLPELKSDIDLSVIFNNDRSPTDPYGPTGSVNYGRTLTIPSPSTIKSVKKSLSELENKKQVLKQKHLVQLDWVSTEDGFQILTVGVGPRIIMYAAVSTEIAQAAKRDEKPTKARSRGILQKSKSMTVQNFVEEIRWMKLRSIELGTADMLPPLPMHISWVRDGILVVGMDNEMHVYSQWRGPGEGLDNLSESDVGRCVEDDSRLLTDQNLLSSGASLTAAKRNASFNLSHSVSSIKLAHSVSMMVGGEMKKRERPVKAVAKSESVTSLNLIQECGLFEAARIANPVLPQYHPKQLLELLNFGKIRRVKAILAHLVRCIAGNEAYAAAGLHQSDSRDGKTQAFARSRALSVAASSLTPQEKGTIPVDEVQLDYMEINTIAPLPIYALLAADEDVSSFNTKDTSKGPGTSDQDYSGLFNGDAYSDEELDDPFTDDPYDGTPGRRERRRSSTSGGTVNPNYFGPAQSRLLANHLTHKHLPGMSSLDQMYLLALADTVSNIQMDFADSFSPDLHVQKGKI